MNHQQQIVHELKEIWILLKNNPLIITNKEYEQVETDILLQGCVALIYLEASQKHINTKKFLQKEEIKTKHDLLNLTEKIFKFKSIKKNSIEKIIIIFAYLKIMKNIHGEKLNQTFLNKEELIKKYDINRSLLKEREIDECLKFRNNLRICFEFMSGEFNNRILLNVLTFNNIYLWNFHLGGGYQTYYTTLKQTIINYEGHVRIKTVNRFKKKIRIQKYDPKTFLHTMIKKKKIISSDKTKEKIGLLLKPVVVPNFPEEDSNLKILASCAFENEDFKIIDFDE